MDRPMRWKLEFPQVYVTIPEVGRQLRQSGVPVRRGRIQFIGVWPEPGPETCDTMIPITAEDGTIWDGFYLGYKLTADVHP